MLGGGGARRTSRARVTRARRTLRERRHSVDWKRRRTATSVTEAVDRARRDRVTGERSSSRCAATVLAPEHALLAASLGAAAAKGSKAAAALQGDADVGDGGVVAAHRAHACITSRTQTPSAASTGPRRRNRRSPAGRSASSTTTATRLSKVDRRRRRPRAWFLAATTRRRRRRDDGTRARLPLIVAESGGSRRGETYALPSGPRARPGRRSSSGAAGTSPRSDAGAPRGSSAPADRATVKPPEEPRGGRRSTVRARLPPPPGGVAEVRPTARPVAAAREARTLGGASDHSPRLNGGRRTEVAKPPAAGLDVVLVHDSAGTRHPRPETRIPTRCRSGRAPA